MIAADDLDVAAERSGDPGASVDFVQLFEVHFPRVVRALQLSGLDRDGAEDVAQEAFARTLGHWKRVRLGTNPAGYVFTTAFRLARRQLRRPDTAPYDEQAVPRGAGEREDEAVATRIDVEASLAAMPPRRRACAVLCLVVGFSTAEAARSLGIAEGTVRKQLGIARETLREAVGESSRPPGRPPAAP